MKRIKRLFILALAFSTWNSLAAGGVNFWQILGMNKAMEGNGKSSVYQKNNAGFLVDAGALKPDKQKGFSTYRKNKYGFEEKSGSVRPSTSGGKFDLYKKNKYGFEERSGSYRKMSSGKGLSVYTKNKYGFEEKTGSLRKTARGHVEINEKNK